MTEKATARLRLAAGILLGLSIVFPIYGVPVAISGESASTYAWDLARGDLVGAAFLAVGYLGPILVIGSHSHRLQTRQAILTMIVEPVVLAVSAVALLAVAGTTLTLVPILGPLFGVPASGSIGVGAWLALGAIGVLALMWITSVGDRLRRWLRARGELAAVSM